MKQHISLRYANRNFSLGAAQKAALKRLFASARPLHIRKWRREELYQRD